MPYNPGIQDTSGMQFAQGIDKLSEFITRHQDEEKNRAREFKSLQELAQIHGIANKDQTLGLDLDTLRARVFGNMEEKRMAIASQQRDQAAQLQAAHIAQLNAATGLAQQQVSDLKAQSAAIAGFGKSFANLMNTQSPAAQANFDEQAFLTGARPEDFGGRPVGMPASQMAAQALAENPGIKGADADNIMSALLKADSTKQDFGNGAPVAQQIIKADGTKLVGQYAVKMGTGHLQQFTDPSEIKHDVQQYELGDGRVVSGIEDSKGNVHIINDPKATRAIPPDVAKGVLEAIAQASTFRDKLADPKLSTAEVARFAAQAKANHRVGMTALKMAKDHISTEDYNYYVNELSGKDQPADAQSTQNAGPAPASVPAAKAGAKVPPMDHSTPIIWMLDSQNNRIPIRANQLAAAKARGLRLAPTQ